MQFPSDESRYLELKYVNWFMQLMLMHDKKNNTTDENISNIKKVLFKTHF